jgi:hypothetical protein
VTVEAGSSVTLPLTCRDANGDPIARTIVGRRWACSTRSTRPTAPVSYTASVLASGETRSRSTPATARQPPNATVAITVTPAADVPLEKNRGPTRTSPRSQRVSAKSLKKFTGTATDDAEVTLVEIALVRATGGATRLDSRRSRPGGRHPRRRSTSRQEEEDEEEAQARLPVMTSKGSFLAFAAFKKRCTPNHWIAATGMTPGASSCQAPAQGHHCALLRAPRPTSPSRHSHQTATATP